MKNSDLVNALSEDINEINEVFEVKSSDSIGKIQSDNSINSPMKEIPYNREEMYTPDLFSFFDFSKNKSKHCVNIRKPRTDVGIIANVLSEMSTTGLIMNDRPNLIAPKCEKELKNHIKLNEKHFDEVKKNNEKNIQKQLSFYNYKLKKEENVSYLISKWKSKIIPNWNTLCYNNETKNMWWQGLPPCIRTIVWKLATENNLRLTKSFIDILLNESEQNINLYHKGLLIDTVGIPELNGCVSTYKTKQIIQMVELDVNRTYPQLNIFQTNGPLNVPLKIVLSAYCCFRKDIGYVQGMSFIVALLLLNMDADDTFIVFANMMNNPLRIALFTLREDLLQRLFDEFNVLIKIQLPKLNYHFEKIELHPNIYLIDWLITIFTRFLPLDIASRIMDLYFRDGEIFIFRTIIGVLKYFEEDLLKMDNFTASTYLTCKKQNFSEDYLFQKIQKIKPPDIWFNNLNTTFKIMLNL